MPRFLWVVLPVLAALPALARAQTTEEKKATVAYLRSLQTDGGFVSKAPGTAGRRELPTIRATVAALRALRYFGGEARDADACRKFVRACYDKDTGGFLSSLGPEAKPDVFNTAVGVMGVAELKMPLKDYRDGAVRFLGENAKNFEEIRIAAAGLESAGKLPPQAGDWVAQLEKMRKADGTFGKEDGAARDTGGAVVALLRLGGKVEQKANLLKVLRAGQRKDGGFGQAGNETSDLETTYRVMRAFVMLKAKPADPEQLRAFVAKCRNGDGGYGVAPGQPSNVGGSYFAGVVLHWLGDK